MFRNLLQSSASVNVRVAPKEEEEISSSVLSKLIKEFSSKRSHCQEISKTK